MAEKTLTPAPIVRTSRGPCIAGTRVTVYNVLEYLEAGWSPRLIQDRLELSAAQMDGVMGYIRAHGEELKDEYEAVLRQAGQARKYWEERNRERLAKIATSPPRPGQEPIYARLRARRNQLRPAR